MLFCFRVPKPGLPSYSNQWSPLYSLARSLALTLLSGPHYCILPLSSSSPVFGPLWSLISHFFGPSLRAGRHICDTFFTFYRQSSLDGIPAVEKSFLIKNSFWILDWTHFVCRVLSVPWRQLRTLCRHNVLTWCNSTEVRHWHELEIWTEVANADALFHLLLNLAMNQRHSPSPNFHLK